MKTRTLTSLVFGLALLSLLPPVSAGLNQTVSPNTPKPGEVVASPASSDSELPAPEDAAVTPIRPPSTAHAGVNVSGWLAEVVKMAETGIGQSVLITFIDAAGTFNLGAEQIIYLHDIGIPADIITAMIQHDADIISGVRQPPLAAPPSPIAASPIAPTQSLSQANRNTPSTPPEPEPELGASFFYLDLFEDYPVVDEQPEFSPVRKPYPVQLTSPIVVYRTQGRIPNISLLQTLP